MILLSGGVAVFVGAHWLKRLSPAVRDRMGRMPINILTIGAVIAMIIGYRQAPYIEVYQPLSGVGHLNNLMMVLAFYLAGVGGARAKMSGILRHPMLWGGVVWAVAHLLVNGDLASIILFGGLLVWALASQPLINMREGAWVKPATRGWGIDASVLLTAGVLTIIVGLVHTWLGRNPFLGSY